MGLENDWTVETVALGKNFKVFLKPDFWADLEETYPAEVDQEVMDFCKEIKNLIKIT